MLNKAVFKKAYIVAGKIRKSVTVYLYKKKDKKDKPENHEAGYP